MKARVSPPAAIAAFLLAVGSTGLAAPANFEEVLDNGLRVIYIRHAANPMVACSVVVGAGAIHESPARNGSSHFLEHLLFNGTQRRTQRELYDETDRYGAYNNATTREDHTLFTLLIQKEFAEKGLDIQADMLFGSTLPEDKFEKEKGIVLEELAKDENDPAYLAGEAFRSFAYAGTPLARPVLGSAESIRGLTRDAVLAYYKERYVPANMVLVVMGDFELDAMKAMVRRTFGAAPKGAPLKIASGAWPKTPAQNLVLRELDAGQRYVQASFPLPLAPWDKELAAVDLLLSALADGDDSPLQMALVSGTEPAVLSASLAVSPRTFPWGTVDFEAVLPAGGDPKRVLDLLADALAGPDALAAARARIPAVRTAARADEVLTADQIHYYVLTRSSYLLGSPAGAFVRRLDVLDEIGDAELDRAESVARSGLTLLRASAVGPGLPSKSDVYVPSARKPASGATGAGSAEEVLPNGLRLRAERNDDSRVFAVHLAFAPRAASEPKGKEGIADFLHRLYLRGSEVHDRAALAARLDEIGARVKTNDDASVPFDDYYTTPEFSFVRLEMPADRWREGLATLGEIVLKPRLDPAEVESVRREMLDLQARRAESTRTVASDATARALAPAHPLSSPVLGTKESIGSIGIEDLRAFHAGYVTGKRTLLMQVGPVPVAEVQAAVRSVFGGLTPGEDPTSVPPAPLTPAGLSVEEKLGKEQASVGFSYVFEAAPGDEAALLVAGAMLSDRLSFRLREEKGLAYSMSASCAPWGGRMRLDALMATRQDNVNQAISGLKDGIAAFGAEAFDAAAVERAANSLRGRLLMRRLTRINQAYYAALDRMAGREAGEGLRRLGRILEVRPEDVRRVARAYFDPARCARIVVR